MPLNLKLTPAMKTNFPINGRHDTRCPGSEARRPMKNWTARHSQNGFRLDSRAALLIATLIVVHWLTPVARAELAAPDNILYGVVVLGGQPVSQPFNRCPLPERLVEQTPDLPGRRRGAGCRRDHLKAAIQVERASQHQIAGAAWHRISFAGK